MIKETAEARVLNERITLVVVEMASAEETVLKSGIKQQKPTISGDEDGLAEETSDETCGINRIIRVGSILT